MRLAVAQAELVHRKSSTASDAHLRAVYDARDLPERRKRDVVASLSDVAAAETKRFSEVRALGEAATLSALFSCHYLAPWCCSK